VRDLGHRPDGEGRHQGAPPAAALRALDGGAGGAGGWRGHDDHTQQLSGGPHRVSTRPTAWSDAPVPIPTEHLTWPASGRHAKSATLPRMHENRLHVAPASGLRETTLVDRVVVTWQRLAFRLHC